MIESYVILSILWLVCLAAVVIRQHITIDRLNKTLDIWRVKEWSRIANTKETYKFINLQNCGDRSVFDSYVKQLQDDGFEYYPKGNNGDLLAFRKVETATKEKANDN